MSIFSFNVSHIELRIYSSILYFTIMYPYCSCTVLFSLTSESYHEVSHTGQTLLLWQLSDMNIRWQMTITRRVTQDKRSCCDSLVICKWPSRGESQSTKRSCCDNVYPMIKWPCCAGRREKLLATPEVTFAVVSTYSTYKRRRALIIIIVWKIITTWHCPVP